MSVGGVGGSPVPDDYSLSPDPDPAAPDGGWSAPSPDGPRTLPPLTQPAWTLPLFTLPPPDYSTQASRSVQTQGQTAIDALAAAAERNTTGPEARLSRTIKGLMDDALGSIRADEAKARPLPLGSPERDALEKQIDDRTRRYENDVAMATLACADEIKAKSGGGTGALDGFKAMLPGYLRECVEKGGVVIPGVPGSFKPRTDDGVFKGPTGVDFKMPWG